MSTKVGDLVRVQGHKSISVFLGWCYDKDGFEHEGWASLLTNGEVREAHVDFWFRVASQQGSNESR